MTASELLAETVRVEGRRVLASLIRTVGDMQLAEDAVQDAVLAALRTWPRTGVPDDPRAWLTVAARRKAYDTLRREAARPAKETVAGWDTPPVAPDPAEQVLDVVEPASVVHDDLLRLVFTCCHPALAREAQVALSVRTLAGLDVVAIARAFLAGPVPSGCRGRLQTRHDHRASVLNTEPSPNATVPLTAVPYLIPGSASVLVHDGSLIEQPF